RLGLPLAAEGGAAGRADTGVEVSSAESFNRGPTCPPPGSASDANESGRSHSCCARGGARSMPERVPRLGLVCITASEEIRFRTVTRTRLLTQSPAARRRILSEIWSHNIEKLGAALEFCRRRA